MVFQEMDHLKMAVAKIAAYQPDILLVEKTVSRFAQDLLLEKNISLVLNIKRPILERIARCTGAQIVPSIDHLSTQKLGHCELFHVDKFAEHHEIGGQGPKKTLKTLMFFEGCPKPLGCTVSDQYVILCCYDSSYLIYTLVCNLQHLNCHICSSKTEFCQTYARLVTKGPLLSTSFYKPT